MAFCSKCGAKLEDGATFCTSCGAKVEDNATTKSTGDDFSKKLNDATDYVSKGFKNVADHSAEFAAEDKEQNKVMAVLAYIGILFLVPLLAAPNSPYAKFHANQGLLLFLVEIAVSIVSAVPIIGWICGPVVGVVCLVVAILAIIDVINGKAKDLPFIGQYKIIK